MPIPSKTLIAVVAGVVLAGIIAGAFGVNFKASTRADHASLYFVHERLDLCMESNDVEKIHEILKGALLHVDPMLACHGGPPWFATFRYRLGSDREVQTVNIQRGRAASTDNLTDVGKDLIVNGSISLGMWLLYTSPVLALAGVIYYFYRKRTKQAVALDLAIDKAHPDPEERKKTFGVDLVAKAAHDALRKSGLVPKTDAKGGKG